MENQTTTFFCEESAEFAVFDVPRAACGLRGEPKMIAAGALRRSGGHWFFAGSLLQVCERFAEFGNVLLGDDAPRREADRTFATRGAFDGACMLMADMTVAEMLELSAADAEAREAA